MPPAHTATQKALISSFTSITRVDKASASRFFEKKRSVDEFILQLLKSNNWNLDQAVSEYYSYREEEDSTTTALKEHLKKLFDKYRDDVAHSPDSIGMSGTMNYLKAIGVEIDDIGMLIVSAIVKSPTLGQITREGFIEGWVEHSADTIDQQKSAIAQLRREISSSTNRDLFKRVYQHTFNLARNAGAKSVALDVAIEYWRVLFTTVKWNTNTTPWLDFWLEFLQERWNKSVNRDLWDQTFALFEKCLEDESLNWWDENGAWPSVIDEFIAYVRDEKRGGN